MSDGEINPNARIVVKVRAVIVHNGKIFLGKLANPAGFFCLPGGTLEQNESLKEGLYREIQEELGKHAEIGDLIYTQQIVRENETKLDYWYWINNSEDFLSVDLTKATHGFEHSEVGFYLPDELSGLVKPSHLSVLLEYWNTHGPIFLQEQKA